ITAIFQPLQGIDKPARDRFHPDDPDDAAHEALPNCLLGRLLPENYHAATPVRSISESSVNGGAVGRSGQDFLLASLTALLRAMISVANPSLVTWRARPKAAAPAGISS